MNDSLKSFLEKKQIQLGEIRDTSPKHVVLHDEVVYAGQVLPDRCLKVYLVMKRLAMDYGAGAEDPFHAPLTMISEKSGKPLSSVQEIVPELERIGLVRKEKRSRKEFGEYNIYYLADEEKWWIEKGQYLSRMKRKQKESKQVERAARLRTQC